LILRGFAKLPEKIFFSACLSLLWDTGDHLNQLQNQLNAKGKLDKPSLVNFEQQTSPAQLHVPRSDPFSGHSHAKVGQTSVFISKANVELRRYLSAAAPKQKSRPNFTFKRLLFIKIAHSQGRVTKHDVQLVETGGAVVAILGTCDGSLGKLLDPRVLPVAYTGIYE